MTESVYECMFILDKNKVSGDVPSAANRLHELLEKHGAEVLASRPWDERKLAYPVKDRTGQKHKHGLYYLTYFRAAGSALTEIDRDVKLNDTVLRSLTLKIDPKLVDIMLSLAQDEHAVALQTVTEGNDPDR